MKARITAKKLQPEAKSHMRKLIEVVVHLYFVEVEGFGAYGVRWMRIKEYADKMLDKYDKLFPRFIDTKLDAMLKRCAESGVYYDKRHGNGEKYLLAKEQDVAFLPYLLAARTIYGFAEDRQNRMKKGVNDRIRYYNRTFGDDSRDMLEVMYSRLEGYKYDTHAIKSKR